MNSLADLIRDLLPKDVFTETELTALLDGSPARRYALVKRAIAKKQILHVRRGLYCLAERYRRKSLNLFAVAQQLYGPSYISLETALAYHQLIPEAVKVTTSGCFKRSKSFQTPLGDFDFVSVPLRVGLQGVRRISMGADAVLLADPLRALSDYAFTTRKKWASSREFFADLRLERRDVKKFVSIKELKLLQDVYQSRNVDDALRMIQEGRRL